jgi:integrase
MNRNAAATGANSRFRHRVHNHAIASKKLDELLETDIDAWREYWAEKYAPATVNRDINDLVAALNFAHKKNLVASNSEWKGIEKLHVENPARTEYLTPEQRRNLVDDADPVIRPFLLALIYTAARPGEMAKAKVSDFNAATGKLNLSSRKGKGSILRERTFPLSPDARNLFVEHTEGKQPSDFIFTNNGRQWINYDWGAWMKPAFIAAGLADDVCTYTIRHSTIADWLQGGIDVATVAKIAGTSIAMIQDHYAKYIPDRAADDVAGVSLL